MSDLFAILYPEPQLADTAMEALEDLSHAGKIELADACAVVKDAKGHVHLHQESNLLAIGALSGLAIGTLLGWFVLVPYLGIPAALIGALVGTFTDHGINDGKMKDLSKEMKPGSSALFILMNGPKIDIVLNHLVRFGGRIFHTSLDKYQEGELEEKLEKLRNLYLTGAELPFVLRPAAPEIIEEEVVIVQENRPMKPGEKQYRVIWYYTQWPQGSEYQILAHGLTLEEAEALKAKKDPHIKGETLIIQEEEESISIDH